METLRTLIDHLADTMGARRQWDNVKYETKPKNQKAHQTRISCLVKLLFKMRAA